MAGRKRIEYIVLLRATATIAVVFYHVEAGSQELKRIIAVLFNWCVPVFIMITGSLYLGCARRISLYSLSKHIIKTLLIIFIWGLVYNVICMTIIEGFSVATFIKSFTMVLNADTTYCFQFWYLYLLVGLYLVIFLIHPWTEKHFEDEACTGEGNTLMVVFFFIAVLLPQILQIIDYDKTFWKGAFNPFTIYIYYLICGAYIHKYGIPVIIRIILYLSTSILLGSILALIIKGDNEIASKLYGYGSFYAWSLSCIIFDFGKRGGSSKLNEFCRKSATAIADNSLGIYILHVMVLTVIRKSTILDSCGPIVFTILSVLISLIICVAITKLMKRIPVIRNIV